MKRKKLVTVLVIALIAAVLAGAAGLVHSRYVLICGTLVPRDVPELDLRGMELTVEEYHEACGKLPNSRIVWDVPFQGRRVSSDSTGITVSSLAREDIDALAYFPELSLLDARACTDYDALLSVRERYPDCEVDYLVSIGGASYENDSQSLRVTDLSCQELEAALPYLPKVKEVALSGVLPEPDDLYALVQSHPDILFRWELTAEDRLLDDLATELDLRGSKLDAEQVGRVLEYLPKLERVDLRESALSDAEIRALADRYPDCFFLWELRFGEFLLPTDAEEIDISGMLLESPQPVEEILPYFPSLKRVIMCHCGLDNETMAALDSRYEDIRFVWSIQIKWKYIRTDDTYFYPFKLFNSAMVTVDDEDVYPLRYCVDMVCIDIGHMSGVTNCEWAAFMPNLQFLVIGETKISDLTPLSSCKDLKYLEMFTIPVEDYSPLVACTGLEDLNLGKTYCDPAPIAKMTWLKNLWWCGVKGTVGKPYSNAHLILAEALPDTNMKFSLAHPVASGWRQLDNYYAMRDFMGMFYLT